MQVSADKIWVAAQEKLRSMLSGDIYNLWFAPLRASAMDEQSVVLDVANDFCEVWLAENYMTLLQDVVAHVSGRKLQVKFRVAAGAVAPLAKNHDTPEVVAKVKTSDTATERATAEPTFNPKNTFEAFVVGNNNNFAHAAALA